MKKNKTALIILCTAIAVLAVVIIVFALLNKGGVASEYQYNTTIIENTNAPVEGDPDIKSIDGFVQNASLDFIELPFDIPDTTLTITAVGGYTGDFDNGDGVTQADDLLSVVVTNNSDKVVSYSTFTVEYAKSKTCSFSPTNLPPHQSGLVFEITGEVKSSDMSSFAVTDSMAVYTKELPLIKDKVGVSFEDGQFVVTNLTSENLGDVYIRYKNISDGNAYLGGNTYSVYAKNVEPYETYKISAPNYDKDTSVIIVVESIKE